MSILSESERYDKIVEDISQNAAGYSEAMIKNYAEKCSDNVKSVRFLQGMTDKDKLDELGNKLYDELSQVINNIGDVYEQTLKYDFDFRRFSRELVLKRTTLQEEIEQYDIEGTILAPMREKYEFKVEAKLKLMKVMGQMRKRKLQGKKQFLKRRI